MFGFGKCEEKYEIKKMKRKNKKKELEKSI